MAKTEVALFSAFSTKYTMKQYFLTYTKLCSTALVQTWWALETLANELAGIIAEQRKALVDSATAMLLSEEVPSLDDKGRPSSRTKYQPIEARLLFIYQFLTGTSIDRDGEVWQGITKLKRARDNYTHRIGKGTSESFQLLDVRTLFEGYHAACTYIADLFEQTPEFAARFVYKYLAFWACRSEAPFIADANEGGLFYLGLQHYQPELIRDLMAPQKSTFAIMS
jgi:hypothetical protein